MSAHFRGVKTNNSTGLAEAVGRSLLNLLFGIAKIGLWFLSLPLRVLAVLLSNRDGRLILAVIIGIAWVVIF